jgi:hypothetical protein
MQHYFSRKDIFNLYWNDFFLFMNIVKILDFDQLIEIENKLRNRHCNIHYMDDPIRTPNESD